MTYRLFYTDVPGVTKSSYEAQKSRLMPYQYHDCDDALGMAREVEARGGLVWEIENDEGPPLDRSAIQAELRARAAELADRPRGR